MKTKCYLRISILFLACSVFVQYGQSQSYIFDGYRMPEYYEQYKEETALKADDELIRLLKEQNRFKNKQIIIEELKNRDSIDLRNLITKMIKYTSLETFRAERIRTEIIAFYEVELVKLNKYDVGTFLNKLEELLDKSTKTKNTFLMEMISGELFNIGNPLLK